MNRRGVLVLGEALCDLFPPRRGVSFADASRVVPCLGGAPANLAVQVARLGVDSALLTCLGADPLGDRLLRMLRDEGVDVTRVARRAGFRTGVTLVELDAAGERRFFPLADKRADLAVGVDDIDEAFVRRFRIVHTGTVGLRAPAPRAAHAKLARVAKAADAFVSLDVNLRAGMYPSRAMLLQRARAALARADIVKATADEARALLGDDHGRMSHADLVGGLLQRGPSLALLTLDEDGAVVATSRTFAAAAAPRVNVVDATGAGDAFFGAALAWLIDNDVADLEALSRPDLARLAAVACRAGSRACTALGACSAMVRAPTTTRTRRRPRARATSR